jgi:hypothetical protein
MLVNLSVKKKTCLLSRARSSRVADQVWRSVPEGPSCWCKSSQRSGSLSSSHVANYECVNACLSLFIERIKLTSMIMGLFWSSSDLEDSVVALVQNRQVRSNCRSLCAKAAKYCTCLHEGVSRAFLSLPPGMSNLLGPNRANSALYSLYVTSLGPNVRLAVIALCLLADFNTSRRLVQVPTPCTWSCLE